MSRLNVASKNILEGTPGCGIRQLSNGSVSRGHEIDGPERVLRSRIYRVQIFRSEEIPKAKTL
jgi:hypothetical protein